MSITVGPMAVSAAVAVAVAYNLPHAAAAPVALASGAVVLISTVVLQVPKGFGGRLVLFHLGLGASALSGLIAVRSHWWAALGAGFVVAIVLNVLLAVIADRAHSTKPHASHPPSS